MRRKHILSLLLAAVFTMLFSIAAFAATEITMEQAKEIALAKTGGGAVTECKLDYDDGRQVYEIEIIDGNTKYEMDIGVTDSQIYDYSEKTYAAYDSTGANEISAEEAKEIALAKTGGGTVVQCKLDFENGKKVYEVDIVNGDTRYEMDVSVTDSKIIKFEQKTVAAYNSSVSDSTEITAEKAQEIALAKTGGGTVVQCKLDYEHGRKVYEIEIVNGNTKYELDVCATDSQIYDYEQETITNTGSSAGNSTGDQNATSGSIISAERAKEIALAKTGGGTVVKCKLDYEDGRQVYEIEIIDGRVEYEMDIGATDGKIYEYDVDYDD